MMTEEELKEYNNLIKETSEKLLLSNNVKSVFPLSYWYKNESVSEYFPLDFIIRVRGTSFLYKSENYHYLITARHNFYERGVEFTDQYIMEQLNHLVLIKNFHELQEDITRNLLNEDNLIRFSYISINANYEHDIFILRLTKNIPDDKYFLTSPELDLRIHDNGYLIGYPQYSHNIDYECGLFEIQKIFYQLERVELFILIMVLI